MQPQPLPDPLPRPAADELGDSSDLPAPSDFPDDDDWEEFDPSADLSRDPFLEAWDNVWLDELETPGEVEAWDDEE